MSLFNIVIRSDDWCRLASYEIEAANQNTAIELACIRFNEQSVKTTGVVNPKISSISARRSNDQGE
jgi:hypothetical protein